MRTEKELQDLPDAGGLGFTLSVMSCEENKGRRQKAQDSDQRSMLGERCSLQFFLVLKSHAIIIRLNDL